jgi:poly(3-hydroxybutyrate) depolymerase
MSATSPAARAALVAAVWLGSYLGCSGCASSAELLGRFSADPAQVSVSGISSGAFMANQLHIAHSTGIMGAGLVAGGLYGCAVDSVTSTGVFSLASLAVGPCMSVPTLLRPVEYYAKTIAALAARGWIDPPSNLAHSRVYMFTGEADQVVDSKTIEVGASLYRTLGVPESQIVLRYRDLSPPGAGHSWVTKHFGKACDTNASPFINNCTYDQAGDVLTTIYGALQPPSDNVPLSGRIVAFDQREFVPEMATAANGMSDTGYLYIPKACEAGAARRCRLHVALHGCLQSAEVLGDDFYTKIGINEWADTNGIMVLYPQTHSTTVSELASQNFVSLLHTNLAGCWNWWGYARDSQYLTKQGVQIDAIWSMVLRLTGQLN